jgi:Flp pilus assembly protein protease CpaA
MELPLPLIAFVLVSIPIGIRDWNTFRIPNRLLLLATAVVISAALVDGLPVVRGLAAGADLSGAAGAVTAGRQAGLVPGPEAVEAIFSATLGAALAGGVLLTARWLTGGGLGTGDVKYGLLLGVAAGPVTVPPILILASGGAAAYIMIRGGGPVPFAPFLAGAAAVGCLVAVAGGVG